MAVRSANLVYEYVAKRAKNGTDHGNNTDPTTTWKANAGNNDITLQNTGGNFGWTAGSGWEGAGTEADPYCLCADGTGDYGTFASSPITSDADFTVEIWTYIAGKPAANSFLLAWHGNDKGLDYYVQTNGRGQWIVGTGAGYTYLEDYLSGGENDGYGAAWQHHAVVYNATTDKVTPYRNGIQSTETATDSAFSPYTGTCYLFRSTAGMSAMKVATVRVYSAALSAEDIAANYAAGVTAASTDGEIPFTGIRVTRHISAA